MALKPGSVNDFTGSMAEAMDQAFRSQWNAVKGSALPSSGEEDRKILFTAIAQGVVKHLQDNANEAFRIGVRVTQTGDVLMRSDNPSPIPVGGGGTIVAHQAAVRQLEQADNRIVSQGEATSVEILSDES